jgi:hypothetical protein
MRTCCRCGKELPFPVVTISFSTNWDHWTGWFCSKACANEYLEQEIIDDQREAQAK